MSRSAWYQNEDFWNAVSPLLFNAERVATIGGQTEEIVKMLQVRPGAAILDMCCGQGWFTVALSKLGFSATGVDNNRGFLATGLALASEAKVKCEFILDDALNFCRPSAYDAAISIFYSFGYHERDEDNIKVLQNLYESLVKGGKLVLDLLSKEQIVASFRDPVYFQHGDVRLTSLRKFEDGTHRVQDRWLLQSAARKMEFSTSARIYSVDEISSLLRACGFKSISVKGGFDGRAYCRNEGRLVILAIK